MTFQKRKLELSIATIVASCALLAACGGGADQKEDPATVSTSAISPVNTSPENFSLLGSSGGFIAQDMIAANADISVDAKQAQAVVINAEDASTESVKLAKAALAEHKMVIVDARLSAEGRVAVRKVISEIMDGAAEIDADGAAIAFHGQGHYSIIPIETTEAVETRKTALKAQMKGSVGDEDTEVDLADNTARNILSLSRKTATN